MEGGVTTPSSAPEGEATPPLAARGRRSRGRGEHPLRARIAPPGPFSYLRTPPLPRCRGWRLGQVSLSHRRSRALPFRGWHVRYPSQAPRFSPRQHLCSSTCDYPSIYTPAQVVKANTQQCPPSSDRRGATAAPVWLAPRHPGRPSFRRRERGKPVRSTSGV